MPRPLDSDERRLGGPRAVWQRPARALVSGTQGPSRLGSPVPMGLESAGLEAGTLFTGVSGWIPAQTENSKLTV